MRKTITYGKLLAALGTAAALFLFASCSKVETVESVNAGEPVPMLFSSYTPKPVSKVDSGSFVDGTSLPDNSSFGVFAFYQEGDVEGGVTAAWAGGSWSPNFMFDEEVEYDGTDYTYAPERYWPSNVENTISFWAYYPYTAYRTDNTNPLKFYESDGTTDYSSSSTGLPVVKYKVPDNPDDQYDILFDSFDNIDKTYLNCTPTHGVVPLTFKHALSWVEFQIIEGTGAKINSMEITDLYWSGTCADPSSISWTDLDDLDDYSISNVDLLTSTICSMLMIPQELNLTGQEPKLTINYDITFASSDPGHPDPIVYKNNSGSVYLKDAKNYADTDYIGVYSWQPGYHYTYKIRAGFERIEFEEVVVSADDWSVGNDNISVPE